jgi:hypothetical protein
MLPPLPPTLLASNPQFAALHKTLTTKLLHPDASTKATNAAHLPLEEKVTKDLVQITRRRILLQALQDVAVLDEDSDEDGDEVEDSKDVLKLPIELRELIYVLSTSLLTTPALTLSPSHAQILASKMQQLSTHLPAILPALSATLTAQQKSLCSLSLSLSTQAPSHHPAYTLHLSLFRSITYLISLRNSVLSTQSTLTNQLTTLLPLSTTYLSQFLNHLSSFQHGTLARSQVSSSLHTSTIASTLASKLYLLHLESLRSTYSPATQSALANYALQLDLLANGLNSRIRTMEDELRLYAESDGRNGETMRELARRYGEVVQETEEVRTDVERLEGGQSAGVNANANDGKVGRRDWEIP